MRGLTVLSRTKGLAGSRMRIIIDALDGLTVIHPLVPFKRSNFYLAGLNVILSPVLILMRWQNLL
jgi:hypothetical protein